MSDHVCGIGDFAPVTRQTVGTRVGLEESSSSTSGSGRQGSNLPSVPWVEGTHICASWAFDLKFTWSSDALKTKFHW